MSNAISQVVLSTKDNFISRLADKNINFEAEAGFAIQALSTDYAMKIAMGNKQSVIDAVTNVAAIGISLNPAKKQAYLVPRDGKICLDISYMGLIDLAVASGAIKWAQAAVVYEADSFELRGYDEPPLHTFHPFSSNRGNPVGVYCVVKTADNEYLTHSMAISEVYAIRDRSQSWKSGKSTPWKSDEAEMIKKTCVKQAYKYWPKTNERLQNAIHYLNTETGEGLPQINNAPSRNPNGRVQDAVIDEKARQGLILKLENAALGGTESFLTVWKALEESQKALVGIPERNRIKAIADQQPVEGEFVEEMEPQNG
jgi:recombination protein RecT